MKKSVPILMLIFFCLNLYAQNDSLMIRRLVNESMTNGTAYDNLRRLCKQVGPRLSGSPNFIKGAKLVATMFKEMGVDTVYMQPCMVPHWVRGAKESGYVMIEGKKFDLKLCALGNSQGSGAKGVKGELIEINSMDQLKTMSSQVKGKIVFFNFPMNPTYIRTFQAYSESGTSRNQGPALASRYGAIAVMVRSLASNPDDHPHTGATRYNDSFPKIPAVAISTNNADYLSKQMKKGKPIQAWFKTMSQMLPDVENFNVVGEIRGSQFPDEIITVGGHLDSWDLAEGANDDGTGVVQGMEVLRTFIKTGIRPKRTIRAVGFANEENGGKGGAKYLELAKANHEKHIFALESDAGGFTPRGFGLTATEPQMAKFYSWKDLFYEYGTSDFTKGGGGADISPLKELGTALCGLSPDSQRYFEVHHAETDVFENVSRRELHLGAANMAGLIWLVSEYGL